MLIRHFSPFFSASLPARLGRLQFRQRSHPVVDADAAAAPVTVAPTAGASDGPMWAVYADLRRRRAVERRGRMSAQMQRPHPGRGVHPVLGRRAAGALSETTVTATAKERRKNGTWFP